MTFWQVISPLRILRDIIGIVKELPSTNWLPFISSMMSLLTAFVYLSILVIGAIKGQQIEIDFGVFGLWLGFLAGMAGFSVKQFSIKRETHSQNGSKSIRQVKAEAELEKIKSSIQK